MRLLLIILLLGFQSWGSSKIANTIYTEFNDLRDFVMTLEPDDTVGGYYKVKLYEDYKILWRVFEDPKRAESIRILRKGSSIFAVTYHKNNIIRRGRTVLRRFYGPDAVGWRNDTIDFHTKEYLGQQGPAEPRMSQRDHEIMKEWDLKVF